MGYDWSQTPVGKQQLALKIVVEKHKEMELARRRLIMVIDRARQLGCTFEQIGSSCGVTGQTAANWTKVKL